MKRIAAECEVLFDEIIESPARVIVTRNDNRVVVDVTPWFLESHSSPPVRKLPSQPLEVVSRQLTR